MGVAKIINLTVCPNGEPANVSFEVGGIIEQLSVSLGQKVKAFNFTTMYSNFGAATEIDTSTTPITKRLAYLFNSSDIWNLVSGSCLMALRAESMKATLDKAVAIRANTYYARYSNQSSIISQARQYYSNTNSDGSQNEASKPYYLSQLSTLASNQYTSLANAYHAENRDGVVKSTTSSLDSNMSTTSNIGEIDTTAGPAYDGSPQPSSSYTIENQPNTHPSTQSSKGSQTMTYTDYGYRIPSIEASAQNARAQISLIDEQFEQFMAGQTLTKLEEIFTNELTAIDMDVKRLQVAYFNTILMPPISGTVTGIYKQQGDRVLPGETVIRIESDGLEIQSGAIIIAGIIIYRGMLTPFTNEVAIATTLFDSAASTTIHGQLVAARGHPSGDDRWEVAIMCGNGISGNPYLPINYHFDFDNTTVTIS